MTGSKRGRGRPKGDGIDDDAELARIADMIVAAPGLRPTTAYKRIVRRPGLAAIRRIQDKWKARHEPLLAAARHRRDLARAAGATRAPSYARSSARRASEEIGHRIDALVAGSIGSRTPELFTGRAFRDAWESPTMRAARGLTGTVLADSVVDRQMRALEESMGARAFQDALGMRHSPAMRRALGLDDDPVRRAARGMPDDVVSRAMRAYEKSVRALIG